MRNLTKQQSVFTKIMLVLTVICFIAFASPLIIRGEGGLDGLGGGSDSSGNNGSQQTTTEASSEDDGAISDYLKGYTPVTNENMQKASTLASPIASAIGTLTGFIMIIVSAGIFLVTALDLCYIGLPFTRTFLDPNAGQQAGGGMGMMGGGMMGGGMMGGQQPQSAGKICFISDEAKACVAQAAGGGQPGMGGAMPGMGGFGGGMGGFGGGMMGGGAQAAQPTKSVIFMYLKKRAFFLIIFAVASIILLSSIFTDCGINLAALLTKILNKFNGEIANVSVD